LEHPIIYFHCEGTILNIKVFIAQITVFAKHPVAAIGTPLPNPNSKLWISWIIGNCHRVIKTIILLIKFILLKNCKELDLGIHIMKKIVIITGRKIAFRVISTWQNDPKITNVITSAVYQMNLKT